MLSGGLEIYCSKEEGLDILVRTGRGRNGWRCQLMELSLL